MWPTCIHNLSPFTSPLQDKVPEFLAKAFHTDESVALHEVSIPVRMVALLGTCRADEYLECPNLPDWHRIYLSDPKDLSGIRELGEYYWFDFDLIDSEQKLMQLRAVFAEGFADTADGSWGACWDRITGELVANITSYDDYIAGIDVVSKQHLSQYNPHNFWIPPQSMYEDEDQNPLPYGMHYVNDSEIEKLIGIAMKWCGLSR